MDDRFAIYVDIEGFSELYSEGNTVLWSLNRLMYAIHRIGKYVFPKGSDCLFAHQLGDGFLIISDFHEENLDRAASIATFLMKYITSFGVFARETIVEGGLSGIAGCYPDEVINDSNCMGEGLITTFPVMGTALIKAVGIGKISPKGPLLTLSSQFKQRLSNSFITKDVPNSEIIAIDWIHTECDLLSEITTKSTLDHPTSFDLETKLKNYIIRHNNKLSSEWKDSCKEYLGLNNS